MRLKINGEKIIVRKDALLLEIKLENEQPMLLLHKQLR